MRRALAIAALGLVSLAVRPGLAELPPGYGGTLRVVAPEPLRVPEPAHVRSLFEATLADAVFDPLGRLLASAPTLDDEGMVRLELREGIRQQDRRPLRARDVVAHLRRVHGGPAAHWLAPLASLRERPEATADGDATVTLRPVDPAIDLRPLLDLRPLAYRGGIGTGTGAYRPRMVGGELRLSQFRMAARGAPYLRDWRFLAPRPREEDLRALILGEVDGSFSGDSLHSRTPARPVRRHPFPDVAPVMLIPNPHRMGDEWGRVVGLLDRERLARVGLAPGDRLAPDLPPAAVGSVGGPIRRPIVLMVPEGDRLAEELGRALAALLDERGSRLETETVPLDRWADAVHRGRWDLRIAEIPPPLPATHPLAATALLVAARAATGAGEEAGRLWTRALSGTLEAAERGEAARRLGAVVLGMRRLELFLDGDVTALSFDEAGRLRMGAAHLPRARTATP